MNNLQKSLAVAACVVTAAILPIPQFVAEAAPVKPVAHKKEKATTAVAPADSSATIASPPPLTQEPPVPVAHQQVKVPLPAPSEFEENSSDQSTAHWDKGGGFYHINDATPDARYSRLSEQDYREVADELGIEVAAIKAVVEIEAGKAHEGFYQPGKPIINFDLGMYRKFAPKHGVSITAASKKAPVIFARPNTKKYGSYQAAQYARLEAARTIDEASALESVFWGMFQIGGFNWKLCGCESVEEFVERMSRSERDQLELFGQLITRCGMVDALRRKQWLQFALKYNGPRAKSRGYHTRMASAYARYKSAE